jgi:TRAP-type mannitol/chloroaromatic compound transport system permease small subunit
VPLNALLAFSRGIDALNQRLSFLADWSVLLACVISAGNAMIRYAFDISSNAWLEIQWYLFSSVVLLDASYTLRKNEHVRVEKPHLKERVLSA